MKQKLLKYILDVLSVIAELEAIQARVNYEFDSFQSDFMAVRAVERDLEIIGEAIGKINQIDSNLQIDHTRDIIGLRNLIAHLRQYRCSHSLVYFDQ